MATESPPPAMSLTTGRSLGDEDSNLDVQIQSLLSCR